MALDNLLGIDWRQAWITRDQLRNAPDGVTFWNGRAPEFSRKAGHSGYTETFLEYLSPQPGESVFDMGSGAGTLALPLARKGHHVTAADFSQGMLDALTKAMDEQGITTITSLHLDWNTAWTDERLAPKGFDLVIASRSTMVADLWDALTKLDELARRKVAVTMATENGPRGDHVLGELLDGIPLPYLPDYIYGMNILFQMGAHPELRFIESYKKDEDGTQKLIRWAYITWTPLASDNQSC
jgi:SAM-dependent methyltransferase